MAGQRIAEFDIWRAGQGGSEVEIRLAGTTQKATVYYDPGLTQVAPNPQILESYQDGAGVVYGKFSQPLYCGAAFELVINGSNIGGVQTPPLTEVEGEDASNMLAKPRASGRLRALQDIVANQIFAEDYGEIGVSPATNTTTLTTAIGQAAAVGGGDVILPAKTFAFNQITLSAGVRLVGAGKAATIMQSQVAGRSITLVGSGCGLANLTLDGINLMVSSVGVYGESLAQTRMNDVQIRRFETGIEARGGTNNFWRDLTVSNCGSGARLLGDVNAGGGSTGSEWLRNTWSGGLVELCTTVGIYLSYEDRAVVNNLLEKLRFQSNTGIGLHGNGARFTHVQDCAFTSNTNNVKIQDDNLATTIDAAKALYFRMEKCEFRSGTIAIQDTADDILFEGCNFVGATMSLTLPQNNIGFINCTTDAATTFTGDTTKINFFYEVDQGSVGGTTTDGTVTKAWSTGALDAGEIVAIDAIAIGNQRNGVNRAVYRRYAKFRRAPSTLAYQSQTGNYTVGNILTGATSGATARIVADSDSGVTGTLSLRSITGIFQNNEIITDGATGSAQVNGTLTVGTVAVMGSVEAIGTDFEDVAGWDFTLAATASEVEARVTGAVSTTINWTVHVATKYG
jgi:hypothetical protein